MASDTGFIFSASMIVLFIVLVGAILSMLYKRAKHDLAYVRTGYGGETIALNTGLFVLPVLHQFLAVNLKTIRLEVNLENESAVLSKDCMKMDLSIDFFLKVVAEKEVIAQAARTLGRLTLQRDLLNEYLCSQLIHSIRTVSAEMTLNEVQQQQALFVEKIQQSLKVNMMKNCMQLESVALKHLDQTAIEYFHEDNAFDAEGLTKLSEVLESEKKSRLAREQQFRLESEQKELEMEKMFAELNDKKRHIQFEQEREIKLFESANALTIAEDAIHKKNAKKHAEIQAQQQLAIARQESEIILSIKSREKLQAQIDTNQVKAQAVKAKEQVKSARKLEKADNQVNIKLLEQKRKDQREASKITEIAIAEKDAAGEIAEATRIKAEAEADQLRILETSKQEVEKLMEESFKNRCRNEADALGALIKTFSSLTKSDLPQEIYPDLIEFFTHKRKSSQSGNYTNKLQAILEDARHSLASEALDTINETKQESMDG